MDTASFDISLLSSPVPSPNVAALLKIKIMSWTQETGFPVSLCVQVAHRTFNLHKFPLISKSGYFDRTLGESNEIELPKDFPGGPETFEMISLFIYGSSTLVDPCNVAALRCAAEFLELTEDYCTGNLCQRFDIYLNQVALQSWDDTLIVLQKCQTLLPWAEDVLIVSRCIESLAFMSCMEILDPERRRNQPVVTLEILASQAWSCQKVEEIVRQELWIKDLIALPFGFFKRIIGSLRRQGMREKYVSPIVLFYADKWILLNKTHQFSGTKNGSGNTNSKDLTLLQGVISLLPKGEKSSKVIPVGFYFALLSRSLQFGLASSNVQLKLRDQIASMLHTAYFKDFIFPTTATDLLSSSTDELATMENIFSTYVSLNMDSDCIHSPNNSIVAELWDAYLTHIATDPSMGSKRIMDLVEIVPMSSRQNHDHLYHALDTFLQVHKDLTQEEKAMVCKDLKCQKLSPEVCIQAVQNDLMPLRLVVQALFIQQLNTHEALKECSDSFRYEAHCKEFSESLPRSQNFSESPTYKSGETGSRSLYLNDSALQRSAQSRKDYESTSFRIQTLEQELTTLKTRLEMQSISKEINPSSGNPRSLRSCKLDTGKKRNPLTSCTGSVNFASQRKYAGRLLKVIRRMTLFSSSRRLHRKASSGLAFRA